MQLFWFFSILLQLKYRFVIVLTDEIGRKGFALFYGFTQQRPTIAIHLLNHVLGSMDRDTDISVENQHIYTFDHPPPPQYI